MARFCGITILAALFVFGAKAHADEGAAICAKAALQAEKKHALPEGVLAAISIVETTKTKLEDAKAWPWTINLDGRGYWFKSRAAAQTFAAAKTKAGKKSMDIGCFQINTKWHGRSFNSTAAMFDPAISADYAARFLKDLYAQMGSWQKAVSAYHSRKKEKGEHYRKKVMRAHAALTAKKQKSVVQLARAHQQQRKAALPQEASLLFNSDKNAQAPKPAGVSLALFPDRAPMFQQSSFTQIIGEGR